ncbi:hypothetical protein P4O66_007841 [Electrophorus voltai]|uniref:Uncharacterized protein n=1 Tax=Electrophorus voltai TaxID=2609070 RepID=A0AAD8ZFZ5_9TELE|nr:hypothetical protein P4O66_007841 [Electrophorus voltai]
MHGFDSQRQVWGRSYRNGLDTGNRTGGIHRIGRFHYARIGRFHYAGNRLRTGGVSLAPGTGSGRAASVVPGTGTGSGRVASVAPGTGTGSGRAVSLTLGTSSSLRLPLPCTVHFPVQPSTPIIPQCLVEKLRLQELNCSLCVWILDFLTGKSPSVWIRINVSTTTTLSTVTHSVVCSVHCVLLFTLLTQNCAAMHSLKHLIKFTDDKTVGGLISRMMSQHAERKCSGKVKKLSLNVENTKEMVDDFRKVHGDQSPVNIDGAFVEIKGAL